MRKKVAASVPAALLLAAGVASAAENPLRGFYIGAGVGQANTTLEDEDSPIDFKGDDVGFKAIFGYRIFKYVAVEAGYADYGNPDDDVLGQNFAGEFTSYSVCGVGLLPVGNVDIFGKLGIARWDGTLTNTDFGISASEDNVDAILGLGAQYRVGSVAFRGEVEGLLLGFDDNGDDEADGDDWITFISVGVTVTF